MGTEPALAALAALAQQSRLATFRLLGRWMRMSTIPNQPSVPLAYQEFDEAGRMVDVMEALFKMIPLLRGGADYSTDRYSERNERARKVIDTQIRTP